MQAVSDTDLLEENLEPPLEARDAAPSDALPDAPPEELPEPRPELLSDPLKESFTDPLDDAPIQPLAEMPPPRTVRSRRRRTSLSRMASLAVAMGCASTALVAVTQRAYDHDALLNSQQERAHLAGELTVSSNRIAKNAKSLARLQSELAAHAAPAPPDPAQKTAADRLEAKLRASVSQADALRNENDRLTAQIAADAGTAADLANARTALSDSSAKLDALQTQNAALASQIDLLKSQLLVAAAASAATPPASSQPADPPTVSPPAPAASWALPISYDALADFATLQFDHNPLRTAPATPGLTDAGAPGLFQTTVVSASHAATLQILHNRDKTRVYTARLSVSLASDGPANQLSQNLHLISAYLAVAAPAFHDADAWAPELPHLLAGKKSDTRIMRIGDTYQITASNAGAGIFTIEVTSPVNPR